MQLRYQHQHTWHHTWYPVAIYFVCNYSINTSIHTWYHTWYRCVITLWRVTPWFSALWFSTLWFSPLLHATVGHACINSVVADSLGHLGTIGPPYNKERVQLRLDYECEEHTHVYRGRPLLTLWGPRCSDLESERRDLNTNRLGEACNTISIVVRRACHIYRVPRT